jgi:hypothetical protein
MILVQNRQGTICPDLFVGAASSHDQAKSRLEAAPTKYGFAEGKEVEQIYPASTGPGDHFLRLRG